MSDEAKPEEVKPEVNEVPESAAQEAPKTEEQDVAKDLPVDDREVSLEEAESKAGIKDGAKNDDAVALAQDAETPEEEEKLPSFFIEEEDLIRVELDILFDKAKGTLVSVSRKGLLDPKDFEMLGYTAEWLEFKPTTYEDMSTYRQRCSVFRQDAARQLVDPIALRNYLVVWHLKDWSMRDRGGKKIELKLTEKSTLDDDSIQEVFKMNPTLLDVALTLFEKDMMM